MSNATLSAYIKSGATCGDTPKTPFSAFKPLNCQCPGLPSQLGPCTCKPTVGGSNTTLTLSCANAGFNDTTMTSVVSLFSPANPVDTVDLSENLLTAVPSGLARFNQMTNLNLSNNSIVAIGTGGLNVPAAVKTLDLSGNLLTQVPTDLTQLANVTSLSLASNGLTSIGSGELKLKATVVSLDVSNNSISTIATDALPGDAA